MLVVMAGLPASGKSTLAAALAKVLPAPVLSVDPVELPCGAQASTVRSRLVLRPTL